MRWLAKTGKLALALLAMVWSAGIVDTSAIAAQKASFRTWVNYCNGCHGAKGEGYRGYYVAPRLAQQKIEFFENRLKTFTKGHKGSPVSDQFMKPAVKGLNSSLRTSLAKYYNKLSAPPAADGPKKLVARGQEIFKAGIPEANVVACVTCHGDDAHGFKGVPRLAGQLSSYIVTQIRGWKKGQRHYDPMTPRETGIMTHIADTLTRDQAKAVAAYLSTLK
jgi:cytochrome c553